MTNTAKHIITKAEFDPRPTVPAPRVALEFSGWGPRLRY